MSGPGEARDYDLVLLGATGFTGRLTARYLASRLAGSDLRWAIAGRDRGRLEELRTSLEGEVDVEVVDVGDLVGLLDLAGRTRVLATTVGPFARHGELVVQACVRRGTHYADITGEPAFVDLIRSRYDGEAARNGVRVVPCCGFDSVPHDLGVRWTVEQLPEGRPVRIRGYVHAALRASGGTATSALEAIGRGDTGPLQPAEHDEGGRRTGPLPLRVHRVPELHAYGVPLPTIDPAVVLASARLSQRYGPDFRYGHYAQVHAAWLVGAGIAGVAAFGALASLRPTRALLRRVLPDPGQGPSAEQRAGHHFAVTFLADAGDVALTTRVSGGDPAYDETAKMLGEAALSLAEDPASEHRGGVLTPATALGEPYRRRLEQAGIRFEVLPGPQ